MTGGEPGSGQAPAPRARSAGDDAHLPGALLGHMHWHLHRPLLAGHSLNVPSRSSRALAAAACLLLLAAGCGGTSASAGRASAAAARADVLSAMRGLYQHVLDGRVGTASSMGGMFTPCITRSDPHQLFYDGSIDLIYPFDRSTSDTTFQQQMNSAARAAGWTFNKNRQTVEFGDEFPYEMARGSLGGHISVVREPPGSHQGYKRSALIEITSSCFNAGSAAGALTNHDDDLPLPSASPAPN
jgi:hypothetical protein